MGNKTITDFSNNKDEIRSAFKKLKTNIKITDNLNIIFETALRNLYLFPNKILSDDEQNLESYLKKWCLSYTDFILPSKRSKNAKGTCSDPAIIEMIKIYSECTDDQAKLESAIHDMFMAAENVQGNLLEEYIADRTKKFGWVWCYGETLRSVDFCSHDGNYLLQIKNKNNTENSSSSAIRIGTPVKKWFRLGSKRVEGIYVPDFKWDTLNEIINENRIPDIGNEKCKMSEEDYYSFLKQVLKNNPYLLKDK